MLDVFKDMASSHSISDRPEMLALEATRDEQAGAARLHRAQTAETVGHLASGLVHDFNHLLSVIVVSVERASRLVPVDCIASRCLADALTASDRAVALISRLLAFTRQQPSVPQLVDIDQMLFNLKPLLQAAVPRCVVELDLDCSWRSLVDLNQLENAILNLAVNARDAMPGGGHLIISTRMTSIRIDADGAASGHKDYVALEVRDSGIGMAPEVQEKAPDPFFTTKAEGLGTGLGLSQVAAFATQYGGMMRIVSEVDKGTSVTLCIPSAGFATSG